MIYNNKNCIHKFINKVSFNLNYNISFKLKLLPIFFLFISIMFVCVQKDVLASTARSSGGSTSFGTSNGAVFFEGNEAQAPSSTQQQQANPQQVNQQQANPQQVNQQQANPQQQETTAPRTQQSQEQPNVNQNPNTATQPANDSGDLGSKSTSSTYIGDDQAGNSTIDSRRESHSTNSQMPIYISPEIYPQGNWGNQNGNQNGGQNQRPPYPPEYNPNQRPPYPQKPPQGVYPPPPPPQKPPQGGVYPPPKPPQGVYPPPSRPPRPEGRPPQPQYPRVRPQQPILPPASQGELRSPYAPMLPPASQGELNPYNRPDYRPDTTYGSPRNDHYRPTDRREFPVPSRLNDRRDIYGRGSFLDPTLHTPYQQLFKFNACLDIPFAPFNSELEEENSLLNLGSLLAQAQTGSSDAVINRGAVPPSPNESSVAASTRKREVPRTKGFKAPQKEEWQRTSPLITGNQALPKQDNGQKVGQIYDGGRKLPKAPVKPFIKGADEPEARVAQDLKMPALPKDESPNHNIGGSAIYLPPEQRQALKNGGSVQELNDKIGEMAH